jgi:multidrug efflux pump
MALAIIIFGILGFLELGVREYPAVAPAVVTVTSNYPGASADVIESQITEPLESEINSVEGIEILRSVSREGRSTVTAEFDLGVDLDRAANDVRDRVARARSDLPPNADPPIIEKADSTGDPVVLVTVKSDQRSVLELTELARNRIKERVQTIKGVASIQLWGSDTYAMKLWLNPQLMAANDVTSADIRRAVSQQNVELPAGRIDGGQVSLNIRADTRLETPEDFNNLIVKQEDGHVVRFEDVGEATYDAIERREILRGNGIPMVMVVLMPQPGANQIEISDEARARLVDIKRDLPDDVIADVEFDRTDYIRSSIDQVQQTIFIALAIVIAVIFLFLGDWRSTLVPVAVIPVAIVGAFGVMWAAGFSINVLTLLAIVLALGLVVDDAIVVLENIYSKIEAGEPPKQAALVGTQEIFFAVVATTAALAAVFVPIIFMGGITGQLFREFGLVLAGAVIISSFAALTLSPMLCARILKKRDKDPWLKRKIGGFFDWLGTTYEEELGAFLKYKWAAIPILLVAGGLIFFFFQALPSELAPKEDRGELRVFATGPQSASYEYMDTYMLRSLDVIQEQIPERELVNSITSPAFGATGSVNSGFHFMELSDKSERERSQNEIAQDLQKSLGELTAARAFVSQPATISSDFGGLPVQFVLQNLDIDKLEARLPEFMEKARQHEALTFVDVNLKFNKPELHLRVDREKATRLGVPVNEAAQALQLSLTTLRYGLFIKRNRQYDVIGQVNRVDRNDPRDLRNIKVRAEGGELVPLADIVEMREEAGPPQLFRFNRYNSATVSAKLAEGYTVGQGVAAMREIADEVLDDSFTTALKGQTRDFAESSTTLYLAFGLALLFIYLVLSAQFESFRDPLTIMMTVPLALLGALFALWYFDQTLNVFSQIGMIMLIGLVTKNGILIVEFANQRRAEGMEKLEAIKAAARVRFRPVLMTTASTTLGILPIALALGAGAESRVPMGIAVIGGMLVGSFFTLFVIPAMFMLLARDEMPDSQREAAKIGE